MDAANRGTWQVDNFDGGLVTNYPASSLRPNQSPDAANFDPSYRGILHPRMPVSNFTSALSGGVDGIRGLAHYVKTSGTTYIIAKAGTSIYNISAGNWSTTLSSVPTIGDSDNAFFVVFNDILIITSDSASNWNTPQQWSGSGGVSNLAGSAPLACRYPVVHKGRLWLFGSPATTAQYSAAAYSALNDPTDFTTANNAGNFYIDKNAGTIMNCACSDGDVIYVSKISASGEKGAIYAVHGDGPANFVVRKIADSPAVGPRAMVATPHGVVIATPHGIFLFATKSLSLSGEKGMIPIGRNIDRELIQLNSAGRARCSLGTYQNQVWVALPTKANTANNSRILVCDMPSVRWAEYTSSSVALKVAVFSLGGNGLLYGSQENGTGATSLRVMLLTDPTATSDAGGGTDPVMHWFTPEVTYGQQFVDKKLERIGVASNGVSAAWTATLYSDGTAQANTISVNMSSGTPSGAQKMERVSGAHTLGRNIKMKVHVSGIVLSGTPPNGTVAELYGLMMESVVYPMSR